MEYVKIYLLSLLIFTVSVWAFEAIFIIFAVIFRNKSFINFITAATIIISNIYQFVLTVGVFMWLWNSLGIILAIIISIFFGGIVYGLLSGVFGFIIRLPVIWLINWAEEKLPE